VVVRKALNAGVICCKGYCTEDKGPGASMLPLLLMQFLKWAARPESTETRGRKRTAVPFEDDVKAELDAIPGIQRLELLNTSQTLNDVGEMMMGNLKTFTRATVEVVEQYVKSACKLRSYIIDRSAVPTLATAPLKEIIHLTKTLAKSFADEDGLDTGITQQVIFRALYIRRQLAEFTNSVPLVPQGHAARYPVTYDNNACNELLKRIGVAGINSEDTGLVERLFKLSTHPVCVEALDGLQLPQTVTCDGITLTVPALRLVRHVNQENKESRTSRTYRSKHGDVYKEPDPSIKVLSTVEALLQQSDGRERGVCDLAKLAANARELLAEARRAARPSVDQEGAEDEDAAKLASTSKKSKKRKAASSIDVAAAVSESELGDMFDFTGANMQHPNIAQLKRLQHIMDLDRCVAGDFGYGTPIQATNGAFLSLSQWYAQYSPPKRTVFDPGTQRDGVTHKWAQNVTGRNPLQEHRSPPCG